MNQVDIYHVLAQHRFFKGMEESQLRTLVEQAQVKSIRKGQYLAEEGEEADAFFFFLREKWRC